MKNASLIALCAALMLSTLPAHAQDAAPAAGTEAAATTDTSTTEEAPVSVEIALGGLTDDAKFSAASSAAETATEARIVYVSELQTGPTNATVDQLREVAVEKEEALKSLREKLSGNTGLTAMLEEEGGVDHIISAALDEDGMLLIFVDDEHQM